MKLIFSGISKPSGDDSSFGGFQPTSNGSDGGWDEGGSSNTFGASNGFGDTNGDGGKLTPKTKDGATESFFLKNNVLKSCPKLFLIVCDN